MTDNTELTSLALEMKKATDEVKSVGAEYARQIANGETVTNELKAKVDEALTKQGETASEFNARLKEIEQAIVRKGNDIEIPMTAGDTFAKALDEDPSLKQKLSRPQIGASVNVEMDRKAITNSGVSGAALTYPGERAFPGIQEPLLRRLTVRDLMAPGNTSAPAIFYTRETGYTNNAAIVSEGSLKPESDLTFANITQEVVTIAHTLRISKQMYDDVPALVSYINNRLVYGLKFFEEAQLLMGSGTGGNLEGLYTAATPYSNSTSLPNETDIDKLRLALLQVELAEAYANGIVLHPTNWALIELQKTTDGAYLFSNPTATTTPRLWGRDIVTTQAMTQGRFLVGDFRQHTQIFDREGVNVAISWEDRDNFVRNMATIRVEERLASAIYRPEALVKGRLESSTGPGGTL